VNARSGSKLWFISTPSACSGYIISTGIAFVLLVFGPLASIQGVAEDRLRTNICDGVNAAALLGGMLGVQIPPESDVGSFSESSLRDIQLQLEAHGVATSVRQLSYQELVSHEQACVVPMRFSNAESVTFCVFLRAIGREVYLVEAGPLIVRVLTVDDFRIHWTGHAVFGGVRGAPWRFTVVWIFLGVGLPLCSLEVYRHFRRLRVSFGKEA